MKFICEKHPQLQIGKSILFKSGKYTTTDKAEIASIKKLATAFGIEVCKKEDKKPAIFQPDLSKAEKLAVAKTTE